MNLKEWAELLDILREEQQRSLRMRKINDENCVNTNEQKMKDYYSEEAARFGIRSSRLDYFIRKIEEMPVTP